MAKRRRPDANHDALRRAADRCAWQDAEFDGWLQGRGWSIRRLENGDYGLDLEQALLLYTFEDPVRWCETYMIEPRTGDPWRFFDYQRESLRAWCQDVVHQDGAEVGKTREITCLVLWGQCTAMGFSVRRPWMLIGAPQQTHLDEIILAIEEQVGVTEAGDQAKGRLLSQFWLKPKRTPHMMQRFLTVPLGEGERPGIGRVYYRPAGHDGEAFRGVHVNGLLLMDEAAKLKRAVQWTEFWRAGEPGARRRVYSVPDGDRATEFFRLSQQAQPDRPAGENGWRLVRWPKSVMPAPFWTPERDAEFVRLYGSRQSPGYVRNVLGEWGDAENPVFGWDLLLPCVLALPEFRILKLHADRVRGELALTVTRIELGIVAGRKTGVEHVEADTVLELAAFLSRDDDERRTAMQGLVSAYLQPPQARGVFWAGVDFGETHDPTEIVISQEIAPRLRDELRVQAKGLPYDVQSELIYAVDQAFGHLPHWGADLGSAGTAVVRNLQTLELYGDARFDERMTGYQFANAVDCIGEDGEPLRDASKDDDEAVIRAPAKHWATQCMVQRMQGQGYALAYDAEVLNWMTSHTAREGAKWPIYSKTNDHNIDARRVQMLRKLYDESGGAFDVFSSGVFLRSAA
jgi:hypothetical protein